MISRVVTRRLAVCVGLLLAACSRHPLNPEVDAAVAAFDKELEQADQWRAALRGTPTDAKAPEPRDFRGRTMDEDVDRWILSPATRKEMKDLRDRAAASTYLADAQQLLDQARRRMQSDVAKGQQIQGYWNSHLPAPYWRNYWHDLYAANGVADEAPDSMLVSIESRMKSALDGGDFVTAGKDSDELNAVFGEATNQAVNRLVRAREPAASLAPRRTPCPREPTRPQGERAKLVRGESVENFYPPEAIKRGESGSVVLRALVSASGCATSVAVQVHSGVPALDAAALQWFESASFTPGSSRGKPIDSVLVWKIRFQLRED